jgi:UDP-glucose 4-epimerase
MPSLTGRSVLITGGAGFIGSHLVDRLIRESPANLVVVDNLFLGKDDNLDQARRAFPALKCYRADASRYDALEQILDAEGIEVVFNLAVIPLPTSLERPRWTIDTNVALTTAACELLRQGHYRTLIQFSSSETYGSARTVPMDENHLMAPTTPYAASKLAGDHVALSYRETFGLDVAIVRPFNGFGPRQNEGAYAGVIPIVVRRALRGEPVTIFGDGEQSRDFIFVRDIADAAVRIYEEPATRGRVLNIASGREVSINYLVRTLFEIVGNDVPVRHEPGRPGDVRRHVGGVELARHLIGFAPRTGLRDGLAETVAWYRERYPAREGERCLATA